MTELSIHLPDSIVQLTSREVLENYGNIAAGSDGRRSGKEIAAALRNLTPACLFDVPITHLMFAECCLSGLWLLHGFLDDSHEISQSIESKEGSFWHGIMHRLEADFGNSKYWYRKVGGHDVIGQIAERHADYPYGFVDACEHAADVGGDDRVAGVAIEEWVQLFEFCYRRSVA
jgi:hypothetical protein